MPSVQNLIEINVNVVGVGGIYSIGEHVRGSFSPIFLAYLFHYDDIRLLICCSILFFFLNLVLLMALFTNVANLELIKITSLQVITLTL